MYIPLLLKLYLLIDVSSTHGEPKLITKTQKRLSDDNEIIWKNKKFNCGDIFPLLGRDNPQIDKQTKCRNECETGETLPGMKCVGYDFTRDEKSCNIYYGVRDRRLFHGRMLYGMTVEKLCTVNFHNGKMCIQEGTFGNESHMVKSMNEI